MGSRPRRPAPCARRPGSSPPRRSALYTRFFVVFPAGVVDAVERSLGRAAMIVECPAQTCDIGFDPLQNTREHPDAVPQLVRVRGMVDVGFDTGGVDTNLLPIFHASVAGISDDEAVDGLPRLCPNAFDVFLQRGERGDFLRPNEAKSAQTNRVRRPRLQAPVTQAFLHFHHGESNHLFRRHPLGARRFFPPSLSVRRQVFPHPLFNLWIRSQD